MTSDRHIARMVDLAIAVATFAVLLVDAVIGEHGDGISVAGVGAAALAVLPLVWRRDAPSVVVFAVIPGIFLSNATLQSYEVAMLPAAIALFSVGLYERRVRSLVIAVAITPPIVIGVALSDKDVFSGATLLNLTWGLLALAAGDALRWRRSTAAEQRLRLERDARVREAEADRRVVMERNRIAQEVHDVVTHSLVAINVQAGVAAHLMGADPEQAHSALREIKRVSGAALTDLRGTLGLIRDDADAAPILPAPQLADIADLTIPLRAAGIEVETVIDGEVRVVPSVVSAAAYRIVQEALTNILRHTAAGKASVYVRLDAEDLEIDVLDDGDDSNGTSEPGNGLRGMHERVSALGGRFEAGRPAVGAGWRVHAELPLR